MKKEKVSKSLKKVVSGQVQATTEDFLPEYGYKERIKAHFRRPDKITLSDKDREVIRRAEIVHGLLMCYRGDIDTARALIRKEFGFTNNVQVNRAIEDAQYFYGAMFTQNKNYQRMLMHQDIEDCLKEAKAAKDWAAVEAFLKLRMKLYQLDEPDKEDEVEYFSLIEIHMEFRAEEFEHTLQPGWQERILKEKRKLMKEYGIVEDVKEVEYYADEKN